MRRLYEALASEPVGVSISDNCNEEAGGGMSSFLSPPDLEENIVNMYMWNPVMPSGLRPNIFLLIV